MHLLPREIERLNLYAAGNLAQKRLARGLRLNLVESTALIATVLQELIRDGNHSVAELMSVGKHLWTGCTGASASPSTFDRGDSGFAGDAGPSANVPLADSSR